MQPTVTRNATHNFQKPESWDDEADGPCGDLQVRAETFGDREIVELISTWKPSDYELSMLNQGGVIEIGICAVTLPVMRAYVVDPVAPALLKYVAPQLDQVALDTLTINETAHGDEPNGTNHGL